MARMLIVIPYWSDGSGGPPEPRFFPHGLSQVDDVAKFLAEQDGQSFVIYSIGSLTSEPLQVYPNDRGAVPPADDLKYRSVQLGQRVHAVVEGIVYDDGTKKRGGFDNFVGVMVEGERGTRAFVSVHLLNVEDYWA